MVLRACFRQPEVLHLAFLDQLLHCTRDIFDRHVRIDAVLIEQIDDVGLEALQRRLGNFLDVLRPAVQALIWLAVRLKPNLVAITTSFAKRRQSLAHQLLVRERAIDFGSIEECHAPVDRRPDQRNRLLLLRRRAIAKAQSHAAQPECRNFQLAFSQFALLHLCLLTALNLSLRKSLVGPLS